MPAHRVEHPLQRIFYLLALESRIGGNANFRVGAGGNANFSVLRYQHVGIGYTKSLGSNPTRGPNTSGFASQCHIGFSSVAVHSRALVQGPVLYQDHGLMMHILFILRLEWSTTSQMLLVYRISIPYAHTNPRFLIKRSWGQPRVFWSLISAIDGSTLPQDCVRYQVC